MRDTPGALRPGVVLAVALLFSIVLLELGTRAVLPSPYYLPTTDPANRLVGLLVPDPNRDYAWRPNFEGEVRTAEYQITVRTNELGLRDDPIEDGEGDILLAVGDSFTVGFGVEQEDSWPELLERKLATQLAGGCSFEVVNAGVSGYSLKQIRKTTEFLVPVLRPKMVLVGVYAGGYWRLRNPHLIHDGLLINSKTWRHLREVKGGYLHSPYEAASLRALHTGVGQHSWVAYYALKVPTSIRGRLERVMRERELPELETALAPLLKELETLHRFLTSEGVELRVVLINPQGADGGFNSREKAMNAVVSSFLGGFGVARIDCLPVLENESSGDPVMRFGRDHHWTTLAHETCASAVAQRLVPDLGSACRRVEPGAP